MIDALRITALPFLFVVHVVALVSNRTIDDAFGDFVTGDKVAFFPTSVGVWKTQDCADCAVNPDAELAFLNTYTSATYSPTLGSISISFNFTGTTIYPFFILANNAPSGITTLTAVNFTLDDQPPVLKLHAPNVDTSDFQFNVLLWSQTGLPAGPHTLVISTFGVDNDVYVNFDYAIYTHDDDVLVVVPPVSASASISESSITTRPAPTSSTLATSSDLSSSVATPPAMPSPSMQSLPPPIVFSSIPSRTMIRTSGSPSDTNASDAPRHSNWGQIASGAAGGALLAIAVTCTAIVVLVRRRKRGEQARPGYPLHFASNPLMSAREDRSHIL